ncbi:MAG: SLBB domain-containing protein [Spirochaetes bacterium]|nr:SLBB domain-containing protein [Spirochaetota bacterium]
MFKEENLKLNFTILFVFFFILSSCKSYVQVKDNENQYQDIHESELLSKDQSTDLIQRIDFKKKDNSQIKEELTKLHQRKSTKYTVKIGDVFNIYVDSDNNFTTLNAIVKSDGFISLKRLGEVEVEGLTLEETNQLIGSKLSYFIKISPKLSVIPVNITEATVNILGEVKNPGTYSIQGNKTLLDIICAAGGTSLLTRENEKLETADLDSAYIVRNNKILPVDFNELINKGNFLHNILLHDKDYIYIPSLTGKQVYIMGEVNTPGKYMLSKNLTLAKLVAEAGGFTDEARNNLLIIRGDLKKPVVFKINLSKIIKDGYPDFILRRDDVIYIPKNAITRYNEVINHILPTLNLINTSTSSFINVDNVREIIEGYGDDDSSTTQ